MVGKETCRCAPWMKAVVILVEESWERARQELPIGIFCGVLIVKASLCIFSGKVDE